MHRSDPLADRLSRHRDRHHSPSDGGPASTLLQPPPDQAPAPLLPRRAQVTIREIPRPAPRGPGIRIGSYRLRTLDALAIVLGIAVLLAILWPR